MIYKVEATTSAESDLDAIRLDDLIAMHPEFQRSIRNARQQKAAGLVRSLADLRQKYALDEERNAELTADETLG